jgi:hypothetical protein
MELTQQSSALVDVLQLSVDKWQHASRLDLVFWTDVNKLRVGMKSFHESDIVSLNHKFEARLTKNLFLGKNPSNARDSFVHKLDKNKH